MKQTILFLLLLAVLADNAKSQNSFVNIYSELTATYYTNCVEQTADGGFITTGFRGSTNRDIFLLKTNAGGTIEWTKQYGGNQDEAARVVRQTDDGGYIVAGESQSFGPGSYSVYLIKTDAEGDTMWTKTFGYPAGLARAYSVRQTDDHGFIITGDASLTGSLITDIILLKTDASGNRQWCKHFGGAGTDLGNDVRQESDGGFIVAGVADSDISLIRTTADGDTMWTKSYHGSFADNSTSIDFADDGGYILTGTTTSFNTGQQQEGFLLKTDAAGTSEWLRTFGFTRAFNVRNINGGYVFSGYGPVGGGQYSLIRTDDNGGLVWASLFSDSYAAIANGLCTTSDDGFALAGYSLGFGQPTGYAKLFLVKVPENGVSNCSYADATDNTPDSLITPGFVAGAGFIVSDMIPDTSGTTADGVLVSAITQNLICLSTGFEENVTDNDVINLFPNPSNGNLTIEFPGSAGGNIQMKITDVQGREMYCKSLAAAPLVKINMEDLSPGIYFINVMNQSDILSVKRIVIIH